MNKSIAITIGIVAVLALGLFIFWPDKDDSKGPIRNTDPASISAEQKRAMAEDRLLCFKDVDCRVSCALGVANIHWYEAHKDEFIECQDGRGDSRVFATRCAFGTCESYKR